MIENTLRSIRKTTALTSLVGALALGQNEGYCLDARHEEVNADYAYDSKIERKDEDTAAWVFLIGTLALPFAIPLIVPVVDDLYKDIVDITKERR